MKSLIKTVFERFQITHIKVFHNIPGYFYSTVKFSKSDKPFNSLQKVRRHHNYDEDNNRIATRVCVSVLGNGAIGQPTCLCLFTEFKCYMFNCGEGSMRLLREHSEDKLFIKHAFITEKSWKNMSGLIDVYLTLQQNNIKQFTVHGPPGVENFTEMISSQQKKVTVAKRNAEDSPFFDHTVEIDYVPIFRKHNSPTNHLKNYSNYQKTAQNGHFIMNYICKVKPRPGDLSSEKCVEFGVPVGPSLLDLKNGKDVVLSSGKLVRASDVQENSYPGCLFLVVDCPHDSIIDSFLQEQKLNPIHLSEMKNTYGDVYAVFHFSPPAVMQSYKYVGWMNRFPSNTLHIVLNESNPSINSEVIHRTQHVLNHIHPVIFPLTHEQLAKDVSDPSNRVMQADAMLKVHIRPEKMVDRENVIKLDPKTYLQDAYEIPTLSDHVKEFHSMLSNRRSPLHFDSNLEDFPEIIFLGTSSSLSTPYRNVSAIVVNSSRDNSILLDCGEGAYTQFFRFFGPHGVDASLRKISCIFLSHHHSDHLMGLFTLVKARKKAFLAVGEPYVPVAVMTTRCVDPFIKSFHRLFEPIKDDIMQFANFFHANEKSVITDELRILLKGVKLLPVPVTHCRDSFGVVLSHRNWKIVYSGDAAPSQALVDAGQDCTLLIHEASIEDGFSNEAAVKMHSTPSQVVEIAELMNAKYAILTHFSRRYLNVPLFPESDRVGCAFDNMRVRLKDLPVLPLLIPTLKCLFSENKDVFEERTSAVVNFEKAFFRTYRR